MSFSDVFKKGFLNSYANEDITFTTSCIAMIACMLIATIICIVYYYKAKKYFFSREFATSLVALAIITTAIILTIQSSIVVSLGMVGALSIVRFRTAVKNPLDLVFLFWSISVGIICGAGLFYLGVALTLIVGIVVLIFDDIPGIHKNKLIVIDGHYPYSKEIMIGIIKKHTKYWNIRSESVNNSDMNMIIEVRGLKESEKFIQEIKELEEITSVSVIAQEGTVN